MVNLSSIYVNKQSPIKQQEYNSISENTTFTNLVIPNYTLEKISITETASNQVFINIGTTETGSEILSNQKIESDSSTVFIFNRFFSKTESQTIYISSSDWNSSSLNLNFQFTKLS